MSELEPRPDLGFNGRMRSLAWGSLAVWACVTALACAADADDEPAAVPDASDEGGASASSSGAPATDASVDPMPDAPDASPDASPDAAPEPVTLPIHFVGRFDTRDERGPRFQWSGSALYTTFRGTGLSVRLRGTTQLHVVLDGQELPRLWVNPGAEQYPIASGLAPGEHTLEVHKRDEAMFGPVQFLGFEVEGGELVPTPAPYTRRLEFIGDSITCGYGNEDTTPGCTFSATSENHYLTYAARAARALGAAHTAIAWSGRGMYRNYPDASRFEPTMPELFGRALPTDATSVWDFAQFEPEAVVINLGTNDFAINDDPGEPFTAAYVSFLERLRGLYPSAHLFAIMLPQPAGAQARVQTAVAARAAAGDARVHYYGFGTAHAEYSAGCDGHPSVAGHQLMADELIPFVRQTLGW